MYCDNYKEIYKYYELVADSFKNKGLRILKTDTHNESLIWDADSIPLAPILQQGNDLTLIEIDADTLQKAKNNFPHVNMHLGDVLTWQGEYDWVLDFSTIDHVEEYCKVLENYKKMAPNLSLVVWMSTSRSCLKLSDTQFYFPVAEFKKNLKLVYQHIEEVYLYGEINGKNDLILCHFKAGEAMKNSNNISWR